MVKSKKRTRAAPPPETEWRDTCRTLRIILQTKSSAWMIDILERECGPEEAGRMMFLFTAWEARNQGATRADALTRAEEAGQNVETSAGVKAAWLAAAVSARTDPDRFPLLLAFVGEAPTDSPAPASEAEVAS